MGFDTFEKMKSIFSIALMEFFEKSWECFRRLRRHRTLALAFGVLTVFGTSRQRAPNSKAPDAGCLQFMRSVKLNFCKGF